MGEEKEKKKKKKKKEEAPEPEPEPEPPKEEKKKKSTKKKSSKRKSAPAGSGIFSVFSEKMMSEFKEGFNFIDFDKDGIIGKEDLRRAFDAIGKLVDDRELEGMIDEAPNPVSFTMLLTMFAERMGGGGDVDEDDTIIAAFKAFDKGDGSIDPIDMKNALQGFGDKFSDKDCNEILSQLPQCDDNDRFSVGGIIEMLCSKPAEEEATTATETETEA